MNNPSTIVNMPILALEWVWASLPIPDSHELSIYKWLYDMEASRIFTHPLPIELQYAIIDELWSDASGLALCSMVCRSWRLQSHRHIFSTLVLTDSSILPFYHLTRSDFSYSAIIPSVKAVNIRGPPASLNDWEQKEKLSNIVLLLAGRADVTTFSLQSLIWTVPEPDPPPLNLRCWASISTLELIGTHFSSKKELTSFLENFSNLRCLVLQDSDCIVSDDPIPIAAPPGSYSLVLKCLADFNLQRQLKWNNLQDHGHLSGAELADLMILFSTQRKMSDLVQGLGGSLNGLHLITQTIRASHQLSETLCGLNKDALETYRDASIFHLNITGATSLRKISLGSSKRVLSLLPWVPYVLAQVPDREPPTLVTLQIAFASSRQFYLDRPLLMYIAKILSQPQFRRLSTIQFAVFNNIQARGLEQIIQETITEVFPEWFRRGILVFTFLQL